jgi:excisionase family DNA binding protein
MTITIPRNPTARIQILAKPKPAVQQKNEPTKHTSLIGVSIPKAAKMLGVGKPRCLSLIREGKIRVVRIGKRDIVSVQSLHDFVDGKKEPCNSVEKSGESQGEKE